MLLLLNHIIVNPFYYRGSHERSERESCIAGSTCNIMQNGFMSDCNGIEIRVSEKKELEINRKQMNGVITQSFHETRAPTELHASLLVPTHIEGER